MSVFDSSSLNYKAARWGASGHKGTFVTLNSKHLPSSMKRKYPQRMAICEESFINDHLIHVWGMCHVKFIKWSVMHRSCISLTLRFLLHTYSHQHPSASSKLASHTIICDTEAVEALDYRRDAKSPDFFLAIALDKAQESPANYRTFDRCSFFPLDIPGTFHSRYGSTAKTWSFAVYQSSYLAS